MEHTDPLDRKEGDLQREGHSQVQQPIRREMDSLDDFEHLGHDSSPSKEEQKTEDLLGLHAESPAGEVLGVIDKGVGSAAKAASELTDDFARHFDRSPQEAQGLVDRKMDSNLLQMGDTFPEKRDNEDKLDKFLGEFSPNKNDEKTEEHFAKEKEVGDFKSATQNFMDMEREFIQPVKNTDVLERYSDSEPEIETKTSPKREIDQAKLETFKDVQEIEVPKSVLPEAAPKPPSTVAPAPAPAPPKKIDEPKKEPEIKKAEPAPKIEKSEPAPTKTEKSEIIEAEAMFCKMGLDAWFHPERLNPKVENLIYWRDPKKTGPIFGGVLVVLLALTYFSFISVVAYLSLFALTGTISFRIYKSIVQAVQKTGDGHPLKEFLEYDVSLPQDKVKEISEVAVSHINAAVIELRRLFLVEDLVDSIKFGVLLWCLTYVGSWFNGMTLIIIAWVALFTLPKVYEANKTQIDKNLEIVRSKLAEITSKVKAAIPIGKKAEEKKEQ